ncbi:hypothetical protein CANINC_003692 [Pichia inconspicua]|uniref:Cell division control protein n=1 Tax=Pichia inconspicua TaxID=52247 RepID=A0A4T0WY13_9ASCO|nr:hypothetical protein CANINC_003692 [[Candida] inconspicua]
MTNISYSVKRSSSLLVDENEEQLHNERTQHYRKKPKVLQDSNFLGVLSPPTTPESGYKTVVLPKIALKSVVKDLQTTISNISEELKVSPYTKAKTLFLRSADPFVFNRHELVGREKEAATIECHLNDCLRTLRSSSIYVSGPPGTGKSAQINASIKKLTDSGTLLNKDSNIFLINECGINKKVRIVKFNCMSLSNPNELFKQIYFQVTGKLYNQNLSSSQLLKHFIKRKSTDCDFTILVLDELDNIIHKSQQLLFELFTWTSEMYEAEQKPNLLVIGIANALNLTDRFLPRLRANCISPKLIPFLPYTADQIKSVITNKLLSLMSNESTKLPPLVHPAAIQFCAKKAAATSGDLRRAFDIMYKSIDLFEQMITGPDIIRSIGKKPLSDLPKVMISQVVKVCSQCFNANFELKLKPLNLQQHIILAFIFKFEEKIEVESTKNAKSRYLKAQENTLTSFFNYYAEKCKYYDQFSSLKRPEFLEVITSLDIHGLVVLSQVGSSSNPKSSILNTSSMVNFDCYKATSNIPKSEFFKHIHDNSILKRIAYSSY